MALTASHEIRKLRTERKVRIGKVITGFYKVPVLAASAQVPTKGDTMPGETGTAPLLPYYYRHRWGKTIQAGSFIELIVDWIKPEAYT